MKNNPEIDFYKSNAVHTVLKRYDFSDDEKKIIQSAIITAKSTSPNMTFIMKSDALLKMVASSREPIKEEETKESVKSRIRAESQYSHSMAKSKYEWNVKPISLMFLGVVIIAFLVAQFTKPQQANWYIEDHGVHTYSEAKTICKSNYDILPTVSQLNEVYEESNIFTRTSEYLSNKGYWVVSDNTPMIYKIRDDEAIEVTDDTLYDVRCLNSANSVFY